MAACQVFLWGSEAETQTEPGRVLYRSFTLNGAEYFVGECVHLFPEDESFAPYIGRVTSAFVDPASEDPHCVKVQWFERISNVSCASLRGECSAENEVVELEEVGVNSIGCISGKCSVVRARSLGEAALQAPQGQWYFSRGVLHQTQGGQPRIVPYADADLGRVDVCIPPVPTATSSAVGASACIMPGAAAGSSLLKGHRQRNLDFFSSTECVADSDESHALIGSALPNFDYSKRQCLLAADGSPRNSTRAATAASASTSAATQARLHQQHHHASMEGMVLLDNLHLPGEGAGQRAAAAIALASAAKAAATAEAEADVAAAASVRGAVAASTSAPRGASPGAVPPVAGGHGRQATPGCRQCRECGAVQTPQWREGPLGPKTLCNACGVRYVRAQQRTNKRTGGHKGKAGAEPRTSATAAQRQHLKREHAEVGPEALQGSARPMRQAALAAAIRTAAFARTGVFPTAEDEAEEHATQHQHQQQQSLLQMPALPVLSKRLSSATSTVAVVGSLGVAAPSRRSLESSWGSLESAKDALFETAPPPPAQTCGDCSTISSVMMQPVKSEVPCGKANSPCVVAPANGTGAVAVKQEPEPAPAGTTEAKSSSPVLDAVRATEAALAGAVAAAQERAESGKDNLRVVASRAATFCSEVAEYEDVLVQLDGLSQQLPADVAGRLASVTMEVSEATSEAADADKALQAIAQVLAARQEAAARAREAATRAVHRMRAYIEELLQRYPLLTSGALGLKQEDGIADVPLLHHVELPAMHGASLVSVQE